MAVKRYRNISRVPQTFYPDGDKVEVLQLDSVMLEEKFAIKHADVLELVKEKPEPAK